jgi:dihydroorotate dehydrogenase electron transfer subunit
MRIGFDARRAPKQTPVPTAKPEFGGNITHMHIEDANILEHREIASGYRLLVVYASRIAPEVKPGQFVHARVPGHAELVLRRPFSVFWTEGPRLAVLYKPVGKGTQALAAAAAGQTLNLVGPLGHGFPSPSRESDPVLVAGGYGSAALYLVARESKKAGTVFMGAKTRNDLLCSEAFRLLGWEVREATEDGSTGFRGLVTEALEDWLKSGCGSETPEFFACGPNPMLRKVGEIAQRGGWKAWLSLDRNMGCGVGACLTCVQKIRTAGGGWEWQRCCKEGPVFECRQILWDNSNGGEA